VFDGVLGDPTKSPIWYIVANPNNFISSRLIDKLKIWCSTNSRVLFSMLALDLVRNRFITCFILAYN
jgi:malate/lactate dehydrogenase